MNPFLEKPKMNADRFQNWKQLYPKPYDKRNVDPYTKTRIILMNGTEFEANWFSHQFARHVTNNDLRRDLALTRNNEKQQQLKISLLKPENESILEHTIGYEQLAVDLTAELSKRELDCYVKTALDFALLEDFDHLYRYANLLEAQQGIAAEWLVGRYTEIMPGRPTISHHRYPMDNVKRGISAKESDTQTVLATMIITAAEQQTMNYYMNVTNFATGDMGRRLYQEIAMVEEEHVTQYESLMDSSATWLEMLLWHEYCECYLYWSCYMTETDEYIKRLWEENFEIELSHLHTAAKLLKKYENKDWCEVIKNPEFPSPLSLHENVEYVRKILGDTVQYTGCREEYRRVADLEDNADFFTYQRTVNPEVDIVPSHMVIEGFIRRRGADYRYQVAPNPVPELRNRKRDNTDVGRKPNAAESTRFFCN
ncbi:MAG: hypothetical protein E7363_01850 [Clostridiales bacterium]|nr:hypothetical protein [Clostridiales bacterium]